MPLRRRLSIIFARLLGVVLDRHLLPARMWHGPAGRSPAPASVYRSRGPLIQRKPGFCYRNLELQLAQMQISFGES
jgi:hypothetical protein